MNEKNKIINQLIRDNLKGYYITEVQIRYLKNKVKEGSFLEQPQIMRKISEIEDNQKQYIEHTEILRSMLDEET